MNEVFAMAQKKLVDFFRSATFADLPVPDKESFESGRLIQNLSRQKIKTSSM